jgi:glucose/mannose-6-phosphate isomerase
MINLDLKDEIISIDKSELYLSIMKFPGQISQSWEEIFNLDIPQSCPLAKNVVISGMGGSALGGRIVDSLLLDRFKVPIEVVTEYNLPNYVDNNSLVILSSYSGDTEETLSAAREAVNRGAIIFAITTGGKLAEFAKEERLCSYIYEPRFNPSGQPRMGLGYSITAILAILARCKFVDIVDAEMKEASMFTESFVKHFGLDCPKKLNYAKQLAEEIYGKIPVIIASEHLIGSSHAFKNQINENSKNFSLLFDIPEINHHLMEGLGFPKEAKDLLKFLFIESSQYTKELSLRYELTKDVVAKNGFQSCEYRLQSKGKLLQIFEILLLGSFTAYYLAILNEVDPTPIPWVDYFKEEMKLRKKGVK